MRCSDKPPPYLSTARYDTTQLAFTSSDSIWINNPIKCDWGFFFQLKAFALSQDEVGRKYTGTSCLEAGPKAVDYVELWLDMPR